MKIIVGTRDAGTPASVWAFDDSGNFLWTYDTGGNTEDVVTDSSNNIYIVGARADNGDGNGNRSLWKLNSLGAYINGYDYTTILYSVSLDTSGNIFVSGAAVANKNAVKISANFGTTTAFGKNAAGQAIAVDTGDNIWLGGGGAAHTLSKYSNALVEDTASNLPYDDNTAPLHIDFLSTGDVIIGFQNGVRKFEPDGSSPHAGDWTYAGMGAGGRNYSIAVDNSDNIYCSVYNDNGVGLEKVGKLNSAGVEQWTIFTTQTDAMDLDDISVDGTTIIVTGDRADNFSSWTVDPDGAGLTDLADTGTKGVSIVGGIAGGGGVGIPATGPDIVQVKKLVAASNNTIWYEDL